ncbi:MAG: T9SS type A sorting domain-containing protein [Bacteroidetes bacterium]|nr:T9SS type A sorting domain-containing protein [Bacteroidota bacterium]
MHFELMEESEVTISIYDTKGSIVAEPFISAKYNLGIHDLALPYQTLSKGVYALRVTIGTEIYKLKWVLIE